jgi:hypothetical protein
MKSEKEERKEGKVCFHEPGAVDGTRPSEPGYY